MTPGNNLLNQALSIIAKQAFVYIPLSSRSLDAAGIYQDVRGAPLDLFGSVQAVNRDRYEYMGLDLQKNYLMIYASTLIEAIDRDQGNGQVAFNGRLFDVMSTTDWIQIDGWNGVLCVEVGPDA